MNYKKRNKKIIKLIKRGLTYQKIGDEFGVTRQCIHQIGKKAGVTQTMFRSYGENVKPETGIIQTRGYLLRKVVKRYILMRDNYTCHYCGKKLVGRDAGVDHKQPKCRGGTHDHSNLVACCNKCNNRKTYKTYEEFVNNEKIKISGPTGIRFTYQGYTTL